MRFEIVRWSPAEIAISPQVLLLHTFQHTVNFVSLLLLKPLHGVMYSLLPLGKRWIHKLALLACQSL